MALLLVLAMVAAAPVSAAAVAAPTTPPPAPAPGRAPSAGPATAAAADDPAAWMTEAEVTLLFRDGPLARAVADLEAGRAAQAAGPLATASVAAGRYLAAVAYLQSGQHAKALPVLDGLEQRLPDLADRVLFRRGQALDAAGRRRDAAAAYREVPEHSILWAEARLAQARALDAARDDAGALSALVPLIALTDAGPARGPFTPEALLLAGQMRARTRSDAAFARRAFLQCWAQHPLSAAANDCLAALKALPAAHAAPPGPEDVVRRAEALLDENRNAAAAKELEKVLPALGPPAPGAPVACRGHFALGKAYRKERQHTKAMGVLAPVVEHCEDATLRVRALYVLASASSIASPPDGLRRYRQLAAEYPSHGFADDALYYAADLLVRDGSVEEARRILLELAERHADGDFRAEALFRAAWLARKLGDVDGAIAGFARIEELFADDAYEYARAGYWRARLLDGRRREGDVAAAQRKWDELVSRYPSDWYGLLARARLAEQRGGEPQWPGALLDPSAHPDGRFRYRPGPLRADRHFRAGVLLLRLGQRGAAADELAAAGRKLLNGRGPEGLDPVLLLSELLDRAGDHQRAHNLVRSAARAALRGAPDAGTLRVWRIAYPPAFRSEIERWSEPAGVEPDLLQALMREESALDPLVVSGAGAIGLTQLMPATAQQVAKKLKLRKPSAQDLMDGPLNIRLGAAHLGGLLQKFGGCAPLAVAAYNVGDGAVRRWVRERGTLPLDEFVEEIPVQETRGYVKRVLRSYAAYRLLYGGRPATPALLGQALPTME
jgi:soluble lytic murein transglycosylase